MHSPLLAWLFQNYHLGLSLLTFVGVMAASAICKQLVLLNAGFKEAYVLNKTTFEKKLEKPLYAANHKWNRKWALGYMAVIWLGIVPFCLTLALKPWWAMLLDIAVILMVYDFFYYLTHRFLFHKNGVLGGPLVWMHAVHHQQLNPCRMDSSYIHPLEVAIGLGLYVATIFGLSRFLGPFNVGTVIVTWVAFTQINLHNHDLWEARFPSKYLAYAARMHHNHHGKFTGGNYATITVLYDWMFGTLDNGQGWGKNKVKAKQAA
jgi:sterol desaturase/sphingolipid hydroxylase (fatty acid hydroxylase superfamily)